jgi:hypothetical protein
VLISLEHWQQIDLLLSKVKRAEEHIHNLDIWWRAFEVDAYPWAFEDDAQSRHRIYRLKDAAPIPEDVPWLVGDAVHNLICALDHVAYRMVSVFTNGIGPFANVYFPIAKTQRHFCSKLTRTAEHQPSPGRIIQRLGQNAIKSIKGVEPYEGGKGAILSHVHQLDIIDKHHVLLTVGSMNQSHTMPPREIEEYRQSLAIDDLSDEVVSAAFLTNSIGVHFPLKAGDELLRVPFDEVNENMHFTFEVAFGEPEVIKGQPIVVTLYQAAGIIRDTIRLCDNEGLL